MAQFDVFKNKNRSTSTLYPYLVEIQSNLLSDLQTTVVMPLTLVNNYGGNKLRTLHPIFLILEKQYLSITTLIAGVDRNTLGENIFSLSESRDEIISALDFMITGI
ncbi:MAG: plasmid maintenance protein CcdB [Gammaproteobacteria bacterium]|nr:plasmid maintenance protein CcdB [Gammaproteobacteria bacterium]